LGKIIAGVTQWGGDSPLKKLRNKNEKENKERKRRKKKEQRFSIPIAVVILVW